MPLAAIAPIVGASLIGGGATVGAGLLAKKSSSDAQKKAAQDPLHIAQTNLINQQTQQGQQLFGQAQTLLPKVQESIDIPFSHYKAIASGDPNEFNKVLASSNAAIDRGTSATRANINQFSPRGAVAGKIANLAQDSSKQKSGTYFDAYLKSLAGMETSSAQYGDLFKTLLGQGGSATSSALQGATAGSALNAQSLLEESKQNAEMLTTMGRGLGAIFSQLLMNKGGASSRSSSIPQDSLPGGDSGYTLGDGIPSSRGGNA